MKTKARRRPSGPIEATLYAWENELGMQGGTLKQKLAKADIRFNAGDQLRGRDIWKACTGEKEEAQIAKLKAETVQLERENKVEDGVLISLPDAERALWDGLLSPLRTELELVADKLASLVNAEHPEAAHKILTEWSETTRKMIEQQNQKRKNK